MVYFICSSETASSNIASALREMIDLKQSEDFNGLTHHSSGNLHLVEIKDRLITADFLDEIINDTIIFLSRHSSAKEIPAFTVHAEGNWSDEASLGGKPKQLSVSSPSKMLDVLSAINSLNKTDIHVTYEATHHGPFLNNPSFFVELGGNADTINNKDYAAFIASAVARSLDTQAHYDKIAVGIGGMHYPEKFTKLALEGKYAFSHIMSKYNISQVDMLSQAFSRSDRKAEIAVIEWKSIKAIEREIIVRELNLLGLDCAKV
jgi:D-aminoacyl-tRNA deacylase